MSDLISRDAAISAIEAAKQDFPIEKFVCDEFARIRLSRAAREVTALPSPWMSVKDRLPEAFNSVLVFSRRMNKAFTAFLSDDPRFRGNKVWILCGGGVDCIPDVTHWMELPSPPKN